MVDTVVIKSPDPEAPEGHDQKMIDAVDKANAGLPEDLADPQDAPEERPQWLPEKFKSPEDMAKAYSELEAKLGAPKAPAEPQAKPDVDPAAATQADVEKALAPKGLNLQDFSAEFAQKGELSSESYEKLQAAGYDKALVDQFIEGQQARAVQFETAIKTEVGGDERYSEMMEWAKANLTPSEIQAYNTAVTSGNADNAKLAALGLNAKFGKAIGQEPGRMLGGQRGGSEDVFESNAQVTEAMRNPLYKSDPAYRAKVQAKLGRSNVF